ncbi:ECF RNA polymerase sigma factor SigE [Posidoniimonas polymericola]|uniref:ECF RNA polymerase sigma factor SigE n=1 Tax=Posidoniimonas polymericola TaxID=2528002 RepID=A0A5C5YM82_9BACT|nr:RNA polymerase sigma factor [Posidoniimonas polymericola]TWT76073.1 ECF RNA polymerase sigma factor SigE [Posidoniimonas polymericola]
MKCSSVSPADEPVSVTSLTLLRAAGDQQPAAWEDLVRIYGRRMYRWCRVAGLQPADAADVVQDALGAVARNLATFRRDRPGDTFRGWLRRIVDNKVRDHYRGLAKRNDQALGGTDALGLLAAAPAAPPQAQAAPQPEASRAVASPTLDPRAAAAIERVRREVGPRNWRFFWRVAVDGQSAVEVGSEFGVSANTVRIVKMRVLRRLRAELEGGGAPGEAKPEPS